MHLYYKVKVSNMTPYQRILEDLSRNYHSLYNEQANYDENSICSKKSQKGIMLNGLKV